MSNCIDKKIGDMISLYELGLLLKDEQETFELHVLDCDYCFSQLVEFQNTVKLINYDPDTKLFIERLVKKRRENRISSSIHDIKKTIKGVLSSSYVRTILAVGVITIILILKPWQIKVFIDDDQVAAKNKVLVMDFKNSVEDINYSNMGKIVSNLLITDLSESKYVNVVPSQMVYDVLHLIKKEDISEIDPQIAKEIGRRTNAKWIVLGVITKEGSDLNISSQLLKIDGESVAETNVTGTSLEESVFPLIDQLSIKIKKDLKLSEKAISEPDRNIADITTHSVEAYRYYLQGLNLYYKFYYDEAVISFEKAIKIDSTFAIAYYHLSILSDRSYIDKALKYSSKASQMEQLYIKSRDALINGNSHEYGMILEKIIELYPDEKDAVFKYGHYKFHEGLYRDALYYFNRTVELDPLYKYGYNMIAYSYSNINKLDSALLILDNYMKIAPNEPNPYDTRGDILANHGDIERAISSYRKVLDIKPDFMETAIKLADLYVLNRKYDSAIILYQNPGFHNYPLSKFDKNLNMTKIFIHKGEFRKALELLDELILSSKNKIRSEIDSITVAETYFKKAQILVQYDISRALIEMETGMSIAERIPSTRTILMTPFYIKLIGENNNPDRVKLLLSRLKQKSKDSKFYLACYQLSLSLDLLNRGDYEKACALLDEANSNILPEFYFQGRYLLGVAYLETKQYHNAISVFEDLLDFYDDQVIDFLVYGVEIHYYLGLAYEKSQQFNDAIEQYELFLKIWNNSDFDIKIVQEAKNNLARCLEQIK